MHVFLDTSGVLRAILNQTPLLVGWARWKAAYASELMGLEARRAFDRLRLEGYLDDESLALAHEELARVEQAISIVPLSRLVLAQSAMPMPTVVKTLDALHLSTALLLRSRRVSDLVFATTDQQQALAARALGFRVVGAEP